MKSNLFVDPDFPPAFQSITRPGINKFPKEKMDSLKKCIWKRPSELPNASDLSLFGDDPSYNDIKQGGLGDCYFLCACSALAEFPQMVRDIFEQEELSEDGSYTLNVYYEGSMKSLKIDDLIPCNSNGSTHFAHLGSNKLWVVLLEKAWAKVNICYENCYTGYFEEAIQFLTGAPSTFIKNSTTSIEDLYTQIQEADDNNQLMGCLVGSHPNDANFKLVGLVEKHLYSLIGAYSLDTKKGEVWLLKVRNPWGYKEWTGDWSDNSPLWTKELKKIVEFEKAEDGAFFIKIEDYKAYFSETYISAANTDYFQCSKIFDSRYKTFSCISLYIYKGTEGYISVNQPPIRRMSLLNSNYTSGCIGFMLFRTCEDKKNFVFIDGKCKNSNMVSLKLPSNLVEGNYIVVGKSYYQNAANLETYFSSYTSCELTMKDYISDYPKLLEKLMIIAAIKTGKKTSPPNHPEIDVYDSFVSNHSNLGCYGFINNSPDIPIKVNCSVNLKNMIELNNKSVDNLEIYISPKHSGTFIFVRIQESCNYEAKYNCTYLPKLSTVSPAVNPQKPVQNPPNNPKNCNLNPGNSPNYTNMDQFDDLKMQPPNLYPLPNLNQYNYPQSQVNNPNPMNSNFNPNFPNQQFMNINPYTYNNPSGNLNTGENGNKTHQNSQNNSSDSSWNNDEMAKKKMIEGGIYRQFAKDDSTQLIIYTLLYEYFIYFVFLNDSSKKLKLKIEFPIINGIILENDEKDQSWSFSFQQGERYIKRMRIVAPNYNFDPKFNYQFN